MKYSADPMGLYELEILKYAPGMEDGFTMFVSTDKLYYSKYFQTYEEGIEFIEKDLGYTVLKEDDKESEYEYGEIVPYINCVDNSTAEVNENDYIGILKSGEKILIDETELSNYTPLE